MADDITANNLTVNQILSQVGAAYLSQFAGNVSFGARVGIGTGATTPANLLEVKGTLGTTGLVINDAKGSSGGTSRLQFGLNDGAFFTNDAARIEARVVANPNMALDFKTYHGSLQTDMTLYNGNLGIGVAPTAYRLDVLGGAAVARFKSTGNDAYIYLENSAASAKANSISVDTLGNLLLGGAGENRGIYIRGAAGGWGVIAAFDGPTGRVGIGTATPEAKLHVSGGALRVGDREAIDSSGYALYG